MVLYPVCKQKQLEINTQNTEANRIDSHCDFHCCISINFKISMETNHLTRICCFLYSVFYEVQNSFRKSSNDLLNKLKRVAVRPKLVIIWSTMNPCWWEGEHAEMWFARVFKIRNYRKFRNKPLNKFSEKRFFISCFGVCVCFFPYVSPSKNQQLN